MELSSDIVEHIGIGLRAPRPFGGMVQVREQVVMKRDDAGKEHPSKRFQRPSAHALSQACGADDGVMRGLLIHGRRAGVPANTDGRKTVGPCNGTFPDTRIHDQNLTVMIGSVGLDHGQRGVHPVPTFIQGDAGELRRTRSPNLRLPSGHITGPHLMGWHPSRERVGGAGLLIDEVSTVVAQSERAWIEQLVDRREPRDRGEKILFHFGKVRRHVKHHDTGDFAEVKRSVGSGLQGFQNMPCHERREHPAGLDFSFKTEAVKHRSTGVSLPRERTAELKQLTVELLKASGFRQRPATNARRVEKR